MQTRAALQLAKNDLDNTVIRAPVAGIAGNRAGQIGQYVKPGTQLLSLVPLPRVYVTANFKETQLTRMRPGQPAEISVDAYPDQPLHGQVESFAPGSGAQFSLLPPDNATGNFTKIVQRVPVRISVPADEPLLRLLRPGLSVTVTIDTRATARSRQARGSSARRMPDRLHPSAARAMSWASTFPLRRARLGRSRAAVPRTSAAGSPRYTELPHPPVRRRNHGCRIGSACSPWCSASLWRSWMSRSSRAH